MLTCIPAAASIQQFDVTAAQLSPGFIAQYENEHSFNGLNGHNGLGVDPDSSPNQLHHLGQNQDASPIHYMDPYLQMMQGGIRIRPLDAQANRCARFIGETGESNPYLLRHYRYDDNDECTISKLTY